jgi:hypothetical protein
MQRRHASRIGVFTVLVMVFFLAHSSGDEPKFYDLEEIPTTTIGGVELPTKVKLPPEKDPEFVWNKRPPVTLPQGREHADAFPDEDKGKGGRHFDCRNRKPAQDWMHQLILIRNEYGKYYHELDRAYPTASEAKRVAKKKYDELVGSGASDDKQKAALKDYQDAQQTESNIGKARDEADENREKFEKQRIQKDEDLKRICPPCPPCPPDELHCIGKCR